MCIRDSDGGVGALLDSLQVPATYPAAGTGAANTPAAGSQLPDGSYPTAKFPTEGSRDVAPNMVPTLLGDSKAQRSDVTRNPITADDVRTRAAFDRQINAAKGLANLLSIVKQATANKNAAQEETLKRQTLYDQAVKKQRDAQAVVVKAESDVNRIKQAITSVSYTHL